MSVVDVARMTLAAQVELRIRHGSGTFGRWLIQLPIELWHAWVGDTTIANAILDRLMQTNHRFTLTGGPLRQKPTHAAQLVKRDRIDGHDRRYCRTKPCLTMPT